MVCDIAGKSIPERREAFALEEPDEGLVDIVVDAVAGLDCAVRVRHLAASRVVSVIETQGFCWQAESVSEREFDKGNGGACPRILEEGLDVVGAPYHVELVVEYLDQNWVGTLEEVAK